MTKDVTVTATTQEHAEALSGLLNEIIGIGGTTAYQQELSAREFADRFIDNEDKICCFTAIDRNGDPVGFQVLKRHPKLADDWGDIATFTKVGATAKGIGTALFSATIRRADNDGVAAINATIRADNTGGLRYYDKMGFETYQTDREVPLSDGSLVDRISKRYVV